MNYELKRDKFLTVPELETLKSIVSRFPSRDTALITLAMYTGARANELLGVTLADFDDATESVFIKGAKGSKDRCIPLPSDVYTLVKYYIPFNIKYRRLAQIWDMYKPVDKSFHSLRHTFAIELYKRTKDIKLVQICLGHKSITSTQVYQDFVYEQNEMRRLLVPREQAV